MKSITIDIKDGVVQIEAAGFTGSDCDKATAVFEEELTGLSKKRKAEFAQRPQHGQTAKVHH